MADDDKNDRDKKVTAATTDAPQEEFISPTNVPSVPEDDAGKEQQGREEKSERPRE